MCGVPVVIIIEDKFRGSISLVRRSLVRHPTCPTKLKNSVGQVGYRTSGIPLVRRPTCPTKPFLKCPSCPTLNPSCATPNPSCPTLNPTCPTLNLSCPTPIPSCPTPNPSCPTNQVTYNFMWVEYLYGNIMTICLLRNFSLEFILMKKRSRMPCVRVKIKRIMNSLITPLPPTPTTLLFFVHLLLRQ